MANFPKFKIELKVKYTYSYHPDFYDKETQEAMGKNILQIIPYKYLLNTVIERSKDKANHIKWYPNLTARSKFPSYGNY